MGKIDNLKRSIQQGKKYLIVIAIIWVVLSILIVAPIAVAWATRANGQYGNASTNFVMDLVTELTSFTAFFRMFKTPGALNVFGKILIPYTIAFVLFSYKGYDKTKAKGKYYDIEHGSSDWSKNGEQYKVLSPNKGIILAKENYLPVNKRGNINTLIVGRFWFW